MSTYEIFAGLHRQGDPLLLANAWDAGSALAVVHGGAKAVATTSSGVAWSYGIPDGADFGAERLAEVVARIVGAVSVPVSVDVEGGYADVDETVSAVARAGAVGINIEDGTLSPAEGAARIVTARASVIDRPLWINARTDVFLSGSGRVDEALERAEAYREAGADSFFVPGLTDLGAIAKLAAGPLPLAVMAGPGAPTVRELAEAGAVRISLGSSVAEAAYGLAARSVAFTDGYPDVQGSIGYGVMQDLTRRAR